MGTSTLIQRWNDWRASLARASKPELEALDNASPWKENPGLPGGWRVAMELHNGNVHPLLWWYGRLLRLKDAGRDLRRPYYDKYRGKTLRVKEWTLARRAILWEVKEADRVFHCLERADQRKAAKAGKPRARQSLGRR